MNWQKGSERPRLKDRMLLNLMDLRQMQMQILTVHHQEEETIEQEAEALMMVLLIMDRLRNHTSQEESIVVAEVVKDKRMKKVERK